MLPLTVVQKRVLSRKFVALNAGHHDIFVVVEFDRPTDVRRKETDRVPLLVRKVKLAGRSVDVGAFSLEERRSVGIVPFVQPAYIVVDAGAHVKRAIEGIRTVSLEKQMFCKTTPKY